MTERRSYSKLATQPAWGLFTGDGKLVATIRAKDVHVARRLFLNHGFRNEGGYTVGRVR